MRTELQRRMFRKQARNRVTLLRPVVLQGRLQATAKRAWEIARVIDCLWIKRSRKYSHRIGGAVQGTEDAIQFLPETVEGLNFDETFQLLSGEHTQIPVDDSEVYEIKNIQPGIQIEGLLIWSMEVEKVKK